MKNHIEQFKRVISDAGFKAPGCIVGNGKIQRFSSSGKRGDCAGWYVYRDGELPIGYFGDWRTGYKRIWRPDLGRPLNRREHDLYKMTVVSVRQQHLIEEAKRHESAATKASIMWMAGVESASDFPYLEKKHVQNYGVRLLDGLLLVPMRDTKGRLWSLQTITKTGEKRFLAGGRKKGLFHLVGELSDRLVICEGYATGASIHEATGLPVAVAFDAGNLESVAFNLRAVLGKTVIHVAADNDAYSTANIGLIRARVAAGIAGGRLLVPRFTDASTKPTDFNDLHCLEGLSAVRDQILGGDSWI